MSKQQQEEQQQTQLTEKTLSNLAEIELDVTTSSQLF